MTALACAPVATVGAAAWTASAPERAATVVNDNGDKLRLVRNARGAVVLEFQAAGAAKLDPSRCPTFQIDRRRPQHFFRVGSGCTVSASGARYAIASLAPTPVKSLVLYRLMNGNRVSFRYTVLSGGYREAIFSLSGSKQAATTAFGARVEIDPGIDE